MLYVHHIFFWIYTNPIQSIKKRNQDLTQQYISQWSEVWFVNYRMRIHGRQNTPQERKKVLAEVLGHCYSSCTSPWLPGGNLWCSCSNWDLWVCWPSNACSLYLKEKNLLRLAYAVKENINDLIYLGFSACVTWNFGSLGWSLSLSFESWHVIIINAQAYIRISCLMGSQKMVHYNIPLNIFWTL